MLAWREKNRWMLLAVIALAVCLRLDLFGKPFVQYFANREVQNSISIRLFQEDRFTCLSLPTKLFDSFGSAEFPLLQIVVSSSYDALRFLGLTDLPQPGDVQSAAVYYALIAIICRFWGLLMTVVTMSCVYILLARFWSKTAALCSLFLYALLPLSRFHDQLFLAEPTIMALTSLAFLFLWEWSESYKHVGWRYIVSSLALATVLLLKISHIFLFLPVGFIFFKKYKFCAIHRWPVWLFIAAALIPAGVFYFSRDTHISGGLVQMAMQNTMNIFSDRSWFLRMLDWFWMRHWWIVWTPVGAILLFIGILVSICTKASVKRWFGWFLFIWLFSWFYYWLFAGQMSGHLYYQGPHASMAAILMGIGLAWLLAIVGNKSFFRRFARVCVLLGVCIFFLSYNNYVQKQNPDGLVHWREPWDKPPMIAGMMADGSLPSDVKIVAGTIAPLQYSLFYYCHREGWFIPFNNTRDEWELLPEEAIEKLEYCREEGAQFYVAAFLPDRELYGGSPFTREDFEELPLSQHLKQQYSLLFQDRYYVIYDLRAGS